MNKLLAATDALSLSFTRPACLCQFTSPYVLSVSFARACAKPLCLCMAPGRTIDRLNSGSMLELEAHLWCIGVV